ncbi:5,10-methylenetetrahydrofolate reductase [Monoraphidium neglectum]|uniref:5,10-methylenetetrahydrofolate reductase n=1 Tax=Monoraphidium neglectum TaxID=145388 RepID=A0A0D2KCH0_9CHLO|nr:5,10-methylenetetrahydrofolate reductase [Monoraphidium neglectum]KIZ07768.1 5,10-methylenetetrahydrofolate reductase [Monoraphidium neglectum]|eukprot:XP_013906787.1 5,10-methylenetetrahydrofolate reductase [Monoraphidium neglectum]
MKIIDKINEKLAKGERFFSYEFFPPRTEEGVENLLERLDRMAAYGPTFCDITWGAGGTTSDVTLDIATKMQNSVCVETMMHLTCTNMPVEQLESALKEVRKAGIQNILALRGDPPKGQDHFETVEGGFSCALDLVRYIRKEHGDFFGIGVAGYPEAHPDSIVDDPEQMKVNYWDNIAYLKKKIEAGADFVVTQLFYEVERYIQFVKDCRSVGITAPILPGIMPIMAYGGFKRMTGFCKTAVPKFVSDRMEEIKEDEEAVKAFGIQLGTDMCKQLLDAGAPGVHMYTLNLERSAMAILEGVGLIDPANVPRPLPWRHIPSSGQRAEERVRPIFWSNRPKSYVTRTAKWQEFPNGRWGNSRSPAYATLSEHPFMRRHTSNDKRRERARAAWGAALPSLEAVTDVFVRYCQGDAKVLPWAEMEDLHPETGPIKEGLVALNQAGYLTINSQPRVNGAPSNDATFGWGRKGGYVYQKAYVEFFCSPDKLESLLQRLSGAEGITYLAVNAAGELRTNMAKGTVNAVTWGVFPGSEVEQPTVVDPVSFEVWKDEAFGLWLSEWGALYEEASPSRQLLQTIHDTWWLVSVVDNDYVTGDLFKALGV